ncbi:ubiquitin carboxyl-terminal hydrolase 15-like, partial [Trifolium medium]|nr:ubiquitin carboxyl-terminal hydrolase 15-like [Trifolium medium]
MRQKSRNSSDDSVLEEETSNSNVNSNGFGVYIYEQDGSRNTMHNEDDNYQSQYENAFAPRNNFGCTSVSSAANNDEGVDEFETNIVTNGGNVVNGVNHHSDEAAQHKCSPELTIKGSVKAKKQPHPSSKVKCSKSPKSTSKMSTDFCGPETEKKGKKIPDEPKVAGSRGTIPLHGINGVSSTGLMKMMGLRKSTKHTALASSEGNGVRCKKAKNIK